jgi:hypothetical protein
MSKSAKAMEKHHCFSMSIPSEDLPMNKTFGLVGIVIFCNNET